MKVKLITADRMVFEIEIPHRDAPHKIRQELRKKLNDYQIPTLTTEDSGSRTYVFAGLRGGVPAYEEYVPTCYGTDKIREAFFLGFMVSREGFCSEYMDDGHAPPTLQPKNGTVDQARAECVGSEEFLRLRELAVDRLSL